MRRDAYSRSSAIVVSIFLALLTLACYWPLFQSSFINLDDHQYVTANPRVLSGLSCENLRWAFETTHASNWHPLTWLSHQMDVQLFGLEPGWHHLTSVLFHIANSLLFFCLLRVITGTFWRSAFVAALFALHPAHVESVAWVSERKDVLSTFFFVLSLLAYARYVESRKGLWGLQTTGAQVRRCAFYYLLSFLFFGLGLMSKPMLVTLPFVLLLLDYWPLDRWRSSPEQKAQAPGTTVNSERSRLAKRTALLFSEKLPFIGLSIASCLMTFRAQSQGHAVVSGIPFEWRSANALVSYVKYLGKAFWPVNLSIFYPYPTSTLSVINPWTWKVILCAALLIAISLVAVLRLKREPWFATGWFWFLGTLVPVIGLVQVGNQAMADRYTYIPFIGVFIMVAWLGERLFRGRVAVTTRPTSALKQAVGWENESARKTRAAVAIIMLLLGCSLATRVQVSHWKSNITIFEHALAVTKNNATAHFNLGADYALHRDFERAIPHFHAALEDDPSLSDAHVGLGAILAQQGKVEGAVEHFREGIRSRPWNAVAHNSLGGVLMYQGKKQEALEEYTEAVRLAPNFPNARNNLGLALAAEGKLNEAETQFRAAIRCDPLSDLAHFRLASILNSQAKWEAAIAEYSVVLRLNPTNTPALNNLAWLRATAPDIRYRDGLEAVKLAQKACSLTDYRNPQLIGTLAAAYAEAGRFDDAINSAVRAAELAVIIGNESIAARNKEFLELYRAGKPYHEQR